MTPMPHVRQLIDPAANSGSWNMALDEVLLRSAIEEGIATLRWYTWREPTVSMGYFQREADVLSDARLTSLPRVRRLSGGGTLVHDQELTYSLTLPASQKLIERPMDLYRIVHSACVGEFKRRGVELSMRGTAVKCLTEPVLCFAREDEHDLVLGPHKVLGSAQRRRRGAILQHGGLLLKASAITPELLGIADLCPDADLTELPETLGKAILREIAESSSQATISAGEMQYLQQCLQPTAV